MRPADCAGRRRGHSQIRIALLLLGLILILAPTLDGAAEASPWNPAASAPAAQSLDLCAVPGLVSASLVTTPAQIVSPLIDIPTLHHPFALPADTDHPPRSA